MNSINLFLYIKNWLFLKNLEQNNPFDLVIFEKFDNDELDVDQSINIHTLENLKYDFGVSGAISSLASKHKNILLILDEISIIYLLPLLNLDQQNITIINLWTGVSSYINKDMPEINDLWLISSFDVKAYEPFDLKSFFEVLKFEWNKYIRIANKEMPLSVFEENQIDVNYKDSIVSMTEQWFAGSEWTVIFPWSMIIEWILCMDICQKQWSFFDLFILSWYEFKINDDLKNSIVKTEKLTIILEQKKGSSYENTIKAKLWENSLFDTEINFLYPNFEKISTNMPDYIFEQSNFDSGGISQKLLD